MQKAKHYVSPPQNEWIPKGWGGERIICNELEANYCGKFLFFEKGRRCSVHFHRQKTETFYCLNGKFLIRFYQIENLNEKFDKSKWYEKHQERILDCGDNMHIPIGMLHQIIAIEDSTLIEFSNYDRPEDSIKLIKGD